MAIELEVRSPPTTMPARAARRCEPARCCAARASFMPGRLQPVPAPHATSSPCWSSIAPLRRPPPSPCSSRSREDMIALATTGRRPAEPHSHHRHRSGRVRPRWNRRSRRSPRRHQPFPRLRSGSFAVSGNENLNAALAHLVAIAASKGAGGTSLRADPASHSPHSIDVAGDAILRKEQAPWAEFSREVTT